MKTSTIGALAILLPSYNEAYNGGLAKSAFLSQNVAAPQQTAPWTMYDASHERRKQQPSPSQNSDIVWSSLANTEKWIQKTMASGDTLARKEISYVCETSSTVEEIVAGLFRRLREMREIGAHHGKTEEEVRSIQGSKYKAQTHRQTLVVVAPSNKELSTSFSVFDSVIQAMNDARRNARDYFTDYAYENLEEEEDEEKPNDWVTSVNLSHMHPEYGVYDEKNPEQAQDEKTKEYIAQRMSARRSPYPSVVIEVRSTPPFEMPEEKKAAPRRIPKDIDDDEEISMEDVKRLEALFGHAVSFADDEAVPEASPEEDLWAKLAQNIEEVSILSPVDQGQQWIMDNDDDYCSEWSSFTSYDTQHVDAAYEFVFSTIAFQRNRAAAAAAKPYQTGYTAWKVIQGEDLKLKRDYLLMPQFLTRAATSFEKFAKQVQLIVDVIPTVSDYLTISTFHPEHVDKAKRSPVPVMVLEWIPEDA